MKKNNWAEEEEKELLNLQSKIKLIIQNNN